MLADGYGGWRPLDGLVLGDGSGAVHWVRWCRSLSVAMAASGRRGSQLEC
jgi:hypothetical protein